MKVDLKMNMILMKNNQIIIKILLNPLNELENVGDI